MDVILHPLDGSHLVEETIVATSLIVRSSCEFWMGKETKDTLTIVGCHTDDPFLSNGTSIVTGLTTRTSHQSTAIKINKYRKGIGRISGCCPDVQVETILATTWTTEGHVAKNVRLHGIVAKLLSLTNTLPRLNGLRRFPTEFAYRSLCKGNTQELLHAILLETFEDAILGFYLKGDFGSLLLGTGTEECQTGDGQHRKCIGFSHNHIY